VGERVAPAGAPARERTGGRSASSPGNAGARVGRRQHCRRLAPQSHEAARGHSATVLRFPEHAVHFYDGDEELVRVVAAFAGESLQGGGAVLAVATLPHLVQIERALVALEHDPLALAREGRLVTCDAVETLARFMDGDRPDPIRFREVVEPLVLAARAGSANGEVRVYGEMVNLLWQRGNVAARIRVEELWTNLVHPVTLLCAYRFGGFAAHEHGPTFREIAAEHSRVVPSGAYAELDPDAKLRHVAELEQRALSLEAEVDRSKRLEEERARLHEAERLARAEIGLLYRLTDAANRAETLDQVYAAALDGIAAALGVARASILLFDSDGVMRFKAWRGLSDAYRAAVEGHTPWRPDDHAPAPVLCADVRAEPALAAFRDVFAREEIGALGFFPLWAGGRLLGKFMVYHPAAHAFSQAEIRVAAAIADQIALAVERKLAVLERERLLGIVGHDLRNPLSAILMSAAALRKRSGDDAARPIDRIVASARRMERLISQLLEFAQARHGRGLPVHPRPADAADVLRNVAEEIEAAHPGARVAVELEGDTGGEWDPDLLAEALSNLVGNAVQHGGDAQVTARVRGAGAEVLAEVHNGGPPIPPELLPHLFDPFRRGHADEAERSQSVGLGLFITREIVRAHGGTIAVRSTADEGTTVAVRLPRVRP
jgi:signal transduction histidine kinase